MIRARQVQQSRLPCENLILAWQDLVIQTCEAQRPVYIFETAWPIRRLYSLVQLVVVFRNSFRLQTSFNKCYVTQDQAHTAILWSKSELPERLDSFFSRFQHERERNTKNYNTLHWHAPAIAQQNDYGVIRTKTGRSLRKGWGKQGNENTRESAQL